MSAYFSTGLVNSLAITGSLASALSGTVIKLYSGTVPSTADAAISSDSTLLCTISVGSAGTGVTMASTVTNGTLTKNTSETWSGANAASGTATYYRQVATDDDGTESTTAIRVQGVMGTDMILSSYALVSAATQSLDNYQITIPTVGA